MWLRAQKNRRDLFGLHAPGSLLTSLVPGGCVAVDAGAAQGLYTYFVARAARQVHAFEPNPAMYARLSRGAGPRVVPHQLALSDCVGKATLHIPQAGDGEASLIARPHRGPDVDTFDVELRTLDSFGLTDVGFVKVDVEGHEQALLAGARETIAAQRPTVFIELEDRHAPGSVERVCAWFEDLNYNRARFLYRGELLPLEEFRVWAHQKALQATPSSLDYVSNFVFQV